MLGYSNLFIDIKGKSPLSSLAPPRLASFHRTIDAVSDGCSNAQTAQSICGHSVDCPPTNYGNGQLAF